MKRRNDVMEINNKQETEVDSNSSTVTTTPLDYSSILELYFRLVSISNNINSPMWHWSICYLLKMRKYGNTQYQKVLFIL